MGERQLGQLREFVEGLGDQRLVAGAHQIRGVGDLQAHICPRGQDRLFAPLGEDFALTRRGPADGCASHGEAGKGGVSRGSLGVVEPALRQAP